MMIGAFQITWTRRGTKGIFGSGRVEWLGGPIALQQHLRGWNFRRAGTRATAQFGHFGHLACHNLWGSDLEAHSRFSTIGDLQEAILGARNHFLSSFQILGSFFMQLDYCSCYFVAMSG